MVFVNPVQNSYKKNSLVFIAVSLFFTFPFFTRAQDTSDGSISRVVKAQVISVSNHTTETIPGTDTKEQTEHITAKIVGDATLAGSIFSLNNDYFPLKSGAVFYVTYTHNSDGTETYVPLEPDRTPALIFFTALFLVVLVIVGGWQSIRGLASLVGSFVLIVWVLIPSLLHGYSPVFVSMGVASLIIVIGSYITPGFNRTTSSAVLGMIITICFTGLLSWAAVHFGQLSGITTEESTYLNFNTNGTLDMAGLLLGGILIGLLGVLYDVAIGQAIAVEELFRAHSENSDTVVFSRAMRIGREHIGALVNTLAIAYVGASLPLLLLFATNTSEAFGVTINRELFATEILRTLVGSIGLVLAVPITTYVAVRMLRGVSFGKLHGHSHSHAKVD